MTPENNVIIVRSEILPPPTEEQGFEEVVPFSEERLLTGKKAEQIYLDQHSEPKYELKNCTHKGCGYDFEIKENDKTIFVEVKGVTKGKTDFMMTEKEFKVSQQELDDYRLVVIDIDSEINCAVGQELNFVKRVDKPSTHY